MSPTTVRRHTRRWIVFFAVLSLLAAAAVTLEIWFNLRQQLTSAQVEQARARWQEKGPASYNLHYTVTHQSPTGERLLARVRGGDVMAVEANGELLDAELLPFHDVPGLQEEMESSGATGPGPPKRDVPWASPAAFTVSYEIAVRRGQVVRALGEHQPLPPPLLGSYDMASLHAGIARLLERDARAGGWRLFNVAAFGPDDGRLLHYVRSSSWTRERIELKLDELKSVADDTPAP